MQHLIKTVLLVMLFSVTALAEDADGVWTLKYTTSTGQLREATLTLHVDGDRISGAIEGKLGSAKIAEGRVRGDEISFTLIRQGSSDLITVMYTGKVDGDTMKLKMQYRDRERIEINAKRVSG